MQFCFFLQRLYRNHIKKVPCIRNIVSKLKVWFRYHTGRYCRFRPPSWHVCSSPVNIHQTKFAVICDEMTWKCISTSFNAVYLSPANWLSIMEQEHPSFFFCESAWEGLNGEWDNEIFRNQTFSYDNRRVLTDILKYCKQAGIQSIFWNKEDTPAFHDEPLSFISTALLFDHIFTTTKECIPKYKALGHNSVHLMMFGFPPAFFHPTETPSEQHTAVFMGSWYADNPERCKDMDQIFQTVLSRGWDLRIYDRMSSRKNPSRQYPKEYQSYVFDAVPYERTGDIMRNARYVININSVKDSETMFARRVFEAMACGRLLISNDSLGLRKLFPQRVWFAGESFDPAAESAAVAQNLNQVQKHYTFEAQLLAALRSAHITSN